MTGDDDKAALAGEYVLGLIAPDERAWVNRARRTDPELDEAIREWEEQLQPLDEAQRPIDPDSQLWSSIASSLWPATAKRRRRGIGERLDRWLWSNAGFWRGSGCLATAIAVLLAVNTRFDRPFQVPRPVAVSLLATREADTPAMVLEVFADGRLRALPLLRSDVPSGRSLELWTVRNTTDTPISLGPVLDSGRLWSASPIALPVEQGQVFEISEEPQGGSPTGLPTGPVLYVGKARAGPDSVP